MDKQNPMGALYLRGILNSMPALTDGDRAQALAMTVKDAQRDAGRELTPEEVEGLTVEVHWTFNLLNETRERVAARLRTLEA